MNSSNQRRYWTGVYLKGPDRTAPWADFTGVSKSSSGGYIAIKIRWDGADRRLQVLTSGLRYFQVERRVAGGTWKSWSYTTNRSKTVRYYPGPDREFRVRSRDKAGNWSDWDEVKVST
jgi:hypothetical protein